MQQSETYAGCNPLKWLKLIYVNKQKLYTSSFSCSFSWIHIDEDKTIENAQYIERHLTFNAHYILIIYQNFTSDRAEFTIGFNIILDLPMEGVRETIKNSKSMAAWWWDQSKIA